jgi:hypothetical protein
MPKSDKYNKAFGKIKLKFFDKLIMKDLSKRELRIILMIIRYSWFCGRGKEKFYAIISHPSMFKVQRANEIINELQRANVIMVDSELGLYAINQNIDNWDIADVMEMKNFNKIESILLHENLNEDGVAYEENINALKNSHRLFLSEQKDVKNKKRKKEIQIINEKEEKQHQNIDTKVDACFEEVINTNKIVKAGIEEKNILITKSQINDVNAYCENKDVMIQAIREVSRNVKMGAVKDSPDQMGIVIMKYYNQIIKKASASVLKSDCNGVPLRYDIFIQDLDTKVKRLGLPKKEAIGLMIAQGSFSQNEVDSLLEYQKKINQ